MFIRNILISFCSFLFGSLSEPRIVSVFVSHFSLNHDCVCGPWGFTLRHILFQEYWTTKRVRIKNLVFLL